MEKSFISGVKKGSSVVYETAKEDAVKIKKTAKNIANERAYQKKEKRVENRVHGVNITTVGDGKDTEDEDVHEISEEIMSKVSDEKMEVYNGHVELEDGIDYNETYNEAKDIKDTKDTKQSREVFIDKEDTEEYDGYDNEQIYAYENYYVTEEGKVEEFDKWWLEIE